MTTLLVFKTILLVLLVSFVAKRCLCYDVDIVRGKRDTTYGYTECIGFTKTTGSVSECSCKQEYATMMSKENEGLYNFI